MKKFVLIVFLMALVPNIAMAKRVRGLFGKSERIEKIMDVDIKGSNGEDLYLGYKTTSQFFFMGVYIKDDGYVLGIKGKFGSYYPLDNQQLLPFKKTVVSRILCRLTKYHLRIGYGVFLFGY
ncbi:MAG: hypothetical protein VX772_06835 [Bacteroidota bacterium]|nr:hypothetical protein [Bacteroidota bacterium]